MTRSTRAEMVQRLNAAFDLLARGRNLAEAAAVMAEEFGLSQRQAYRYLQEAQGIKRPLPAAMPTVPITIKVPEDVVVKLRAHAQDSGLTIGEVVARAVLRWIAQERRHG